MQSADFAICNMYHIVLILYIYIYIYRERERGRWVLGWTVLLIVFYGSVFRGFPLASWQSSTTLESHRVLFLWLPCPFVILHAPELSATLESHRVVVPLTSLSVCYSVCPKAIRNRGEPQSCFALTSLPICYFTRPKLGLFLISFRRRRHRAQRTMPML